MNRGVTYWTDGVEQRILYVAGTFLFALDAMAQATKMGNLFVLNRETGEPFFPVEERPVPRSEVPGEESWPTQPFPVASFSFLFL